MTEYDQAETQSAFRVTQGRERGYHRTAVDTFLAAARDSFEQDQDQLTAAEIRIASFPLVKGGYAVSEVDAALGRVEDAFAARERERVVREDGPEAWVVAARGEAQIVLDHLSRDRRRKFARTGLLSFGYRIDEVDHVAERIVRYLRDGDALSAEQLRSAAFRMQRRGYREEQVDALLDATIDVILAVR
ncbi:DivIVA domain-containing protein [Microbacterium sp. A82]|uniref:DivIVA domain-containing protein n=1 Tax=unclassified Microbacterium TaxID=2609290 RepID=UPI003F2F4AA7